MAATDERHPGESRPATLPAGRVASCGETRGPETSTPLEGGFRRNDDSLRRQAMTAAATLLGLIPTAQAGPNPAGETAPSADRWTWDTSFMHYKENERITVIEPQVAVRREFADSRSLSILATVDTISGATPLGTLPETGNTAPATVTGPSGQPINPVVGKVPTSEMTDTRVSLNTTYLKPLSSVSRRVIGATVSGERDFLSAGFETTYHRDFNQKNTTLSLGVAPEFDRITPNGGLPRAYGIRGAGDEFEGSSDHKILVSGLIGVTQILNKKTLMQFNYAPTYENGYLNDPYKLLSVVNDPGDPQYALHENRPDNRLAHSFYWLTRYNITNLDVFGLSLRFYGDDWGIRSQTIDFSYRWHYHAQRFFEPHVRYYHQTKADFHYIGLTQGGVLPEFASADYRLSDLDGVTIGFRTNWIFRNASELILRFDHYTQTGDKRPKSAVGAQRAFDLFPTLNATIIQVEYRFEPRKLFHKER